MNLIEIANQLKDVPDQMLLKEVQSPSGAYPAYLVVTEMGRRKRMRDQAMKEAPTTTVAQDLSEPNRDQMMQAMAQLQSQKAAEEAAAAAAGKTDEELAAEEAAAAGAFVAAPQTDDRGSARSARQ